MVENHLRKFTNAKGEMQAINKVMIERLRAIADGKLEATTKDKTFLTHEMRESQLMKEGKGYDEAHAQACKEYGVTTDMEKNTNDHPFYTEEAIQADYNESMSEI